MKPIKIFKVGTHTSMQGVSKEYTRDMLADCVAAYSPQTHEAPLVVGHPKTDDPAMGWVDHLELSDDGYLLAYPKQIDADFAESVNAGKHNKVSASFYLPDSQANPTPGKLYLRHVGFLGAQPPAVKGLGTVQFSENEDGVVDFADWGHSLAADLFRKIREWLIDEKGLEDADKIVPNWLVESLREYADRNPAEVAASFTEFAQDIGLVIPAKDDATPNPTPAADHAEAPKTAREIELEQQLAQANATLAAQKTAEQQSLASDFAEELVEAGQLPPKLKEKAVSLLTAAQQNEQVVSFSEGEQSFAEGLKAFLSDLPKIIEFGEHRPKGHVDPNANTPVNPLLADAESRSAH
jgi:hypothetical protein